MLSFKPAFFTLYFHLSTGSLVPLHFLLQGWCNLHIWGYWYFSQQSWFQLDDSIYQQSMMYSAYKLNKQGNNIQPWDTPFPIWNQSIVPCLVLTCFLTCIQVSQEADKVVWYSRLFKNFPHFVVIHIVKAFNIVNEAEVDFFLNSLAFFLWFNGCWQFYLWLLCLF